MAAWVLVADGPSAVAGADGTFAISGVPAGRYRVTAWHERLAEQSAEVTVTAAGVAPLDFSFRE